MSQHTETPDSTLLLAGTVARSILQTVGAGTATHGAVVSENDIQTAVGGIVALIGVGWGIWQKRKIAKTVKS